MKDGFYQMTDHDYFEIDALSNSFLIRFDRSPAHAYAEMDETSFMKYGKFGHAFLLSPYEFKKLILAPPEIKNRKNVPYPDFLKMHPGNENNIILHKEYEAFKKNKEKILNYEIESNVKFGDFYDKCKKEITAIYFDPVFEQLLKGKLDLLFYNDVNPIVFDPKFTTNSKDLEKKIIDRHLKYYRQAAFYIELIYQLTGKMSIFYFIGIETKKPFGIDFFTLSEDLLLAGKTENMLSIEKFKKWKEAGSVIKSSWEGVNIVQRPSWMKI